MLNKKLISISSFKSNRLKEHILIAGRSGSGKTNLVFHADGWDDEKPHQSTWHLIGRGGIGT